MAAIILRRKQSQQRTLSSTNQVADRLRALDSKEVEGQYVVEMLMLDGFVMRKCSVSQFES